MPTDCLGRRSRFKQSPAGKHLKITDRDIAIMRWLYRYRYLSSTQLVAHIKPKSEKRFIERLGDLFHETGLINRPKVQWRHFDAHCSSIIYELSAKGLDLLANNDQLHQRTTTLSRRSHSGRRPQFEHAMMIVNVLVTIELEVSKTLGQRFVCVDEILDRAPEKTRQARNPLAVPVTIMPSARFPDIRRPWDTHIIPDGLYGIEYLIEGEKRYRFWALECENLSPVHRSSARNSSLARKRAAYDALIHTRKYQDHWGIPNLKLDLRSRSQLVGQRKTPTLQVGVGFLSNPQET